MRQWEGLRHRQVGISFLDLDGQHGEETAISVDRTILDHKGVQEVLPTWYAIWRSTGEMDKWLPVETVQGTDAREPVQRTRGTVDLEGSEKKL